MIRLFARQLSCRIGLHSWRYDPDCLSGEYHLYCICRVCRFCDARTSENCII